MIVPVVLSMTCTLIKPAHAGANQARFRITGDLIGTYRHGRFSNCGSSRG